MTALTFTGLHAAPHRKLHMNQVQLRAVKISRQEDERGLSIICELGRQPRLAILAFCPAGVKSHLEKLLFDEIH